MSGPRKIAVVGASGYSGEELVRLLARHPFAELVALSSRQFAGKPLGEVYPRFDGHPLGGLPFVGSEVKEILATGADTAFLALPHGVAAEFAGPLLSAGLRVLDLSADFRIKDPAVYQSFYGHPLASPELAEESVYGLPEVYRDRIREARLVACPGCYPTSVILPLAPLLRAQLLSLDFISAFSVSGLSGAGRGAGADYLFAECHESVRAYGVPKHRHLGEIEQELCAAAGREIRIEFIPHLVPMTRGIHTTIRAQAAPGCGPEEISAAYANAYAKEPFVRVLKGNRFPDTKVVVHSNYLDIAWRFDERTQAVLLFSAEDNLVKGAAGQAVQCLNIMGGWPEETALL